jgi:hypothetical protein
LSGNWAETSAGRPQSVSSVITVSQPPYVASADGNPENALAEFSQELDILEIVNEDALKESGSEADSQESVTEERIKAREASLQQLQTSIPPTASKSCKGKQKVLGIEVSGRSRIHAAGRNKHGPDAVIVLKEEKVGPIFDPNA